MNIPRSLSVSGIIGLQIYLANLKTFNFFELALQHMHKFKKSPTYFIIEITLTQLCLLFIIVINIIISYGRLA